MTTSHLSVLTTDVGLFFFKTTHLHEVFSEAPHQLKHFRLMRCVHTISSDMHQIILFWQQVVQLTSSLLSPAPNNSVENGNPRHRTTEKSSFLTHIPEQLPTS